MGSGREEGQGAKNSETWTHEGRGRGETEGEKRVRVGLKFNSTDHLNIYCMNNPNVWSSIPYVRRVVWYVELGSSIEVILGPRHRRG